MANAMDYKQILDNSSKAFSTAMRDLECVVLEYKAENIKLRSQLEREKKRTAMLEAKLNAMVFNPKEVKL